MGGCRMKRNERVIWWGKGMINLFTSDFVSFFCCFKFCSFSSSPLKMCITMCTLSIHSQSIQVVLCADERCFFFSVSGQEERVTQEHKISVDSWAVVWWRVEKNKGRRKSIFVCFICHCCRNLLFAVKRWCHPRREAQNSSNGCHHL